jgi:hypothetical protein
MSRLMRKGRCPIFDSEQLLSEVPNQEFKVASLEQMETILLPGKHLRDLLRGSGGCEDRTVAELVFEVAQEGDGGYRGGRLTCNIFAQAVSWMNLARTCTKPFEQTSLTE